jgi:hypothetical protein
MKAVDGELAIAVKLMGTPRAAWTQAWLKYVAKPVLNGYRSRIL